MWWTLLVSYFSFLAAVILYVTSMRDPIVVAKDKDHKKHDKKHAPVEDLDGSDDEGEDGEPNEVRLFLVKARGLVSMDRTFGFHQAGDPYAKVEFGERTRRTASVANSTDPSFALEKMKIAFDAALHKELTLSVWDEDNLTGGEDDAMGSVTIPVESLTREYEVKWYKLQGEASAAWGRIPATGEVCVRAKCVRNARRAKLWKKDGPMLPSCAAARFSMATVLAFFWLACFLFSLLWQAFASVCEFSAGKIVSLLISVLTGFRVSIARVSVRFGVGKGARTEIVLSGLTVYNPAGYFKAPFVLEIVRVEVHANLVSLLRALAYVKATYPPQPKQPLPAALKNAKQSAPKDAVGFEIDLIRLDGITLFTEKQPSPLVGVHEELLNLWGFLGGKPDLSKLPDLTMQTLHPELPFAALDVPLMLSIRCFLMNDVNLYLEDLISDLCGDPDGCGKVTKQRPVEIDHILVDYDAFHPNGKQAMWLLDLVKIVVPKVLPKIPLASMIGASVVAAASSFRSKKNKDDKHRSLLDNLRGVPGIHSAVADAISEPSAAATKLK